MSIVGANVLSPQLNINVTSGSGSSRFPQFSVNNSCAESKRGGLLGGSWEPKALRVFFKKLDTKWANKITNVNPNIIEAFDTTSNKLITIDLLNVMEGYSRYDADENGVNKTALTLLYLKLLSDRPESFNHRMDLRPGENKVFSFENKPLGDYIIFFGSGQENTQNDKWHFRRVNIKRNRKYSIVYRQELGRENGLGEVEVKKI